MPTVYYKCDKCKLPYSSIQEAARCEESHLAAVYVREAEYRAGPYPFRVVLIFPDGNEAEYLRQD